MMLRSFPPSGCGWYMYTPWHPLSAAAAVGISGALSAAVQCLSSFHCSVTPVLLPASTVFHAILPS